MDEKAHILIIDDDKIIGRTLAEILRMEGYAAEVVETGEDAIDMAQDRFFNVNLIDLKLPDISGIDVLKTFRKKYPSRMNIIITGFATLQNSVEALNLGANAYIMKPIDPKKLDGMIKECLKRQRKILKETRGVLWNKLGRNLWKMEHEDLIIDTI